MPAWIAHAERLPERKMSLTALAREQLLAARSALSGRSAKTVFGGHEQVLRQTVIALSSGQALQEHDSPGEATVHVLHGRVRLDTAGASWAGSQGDLLVIPAARHGRRRSRTRWCCSRWRGSADWRELGVARGCPPPGRRGQEWFCVSRRQPRWQGTAFTSMTAIVSPPGSGMHVPRPAPHSAR